MGRHGPRFETLCDEARGRIREVTPEALRPRLGHASAPLLIDTREDREWDAGRIPHSVHLGRGVIERDIEAHVPDLDRELVLYCGGGYRSALAAEMLERMGYRNVWSLAGGRRRWQELGYPWDEGEPPPHDGFTTG